MKILVTGAAGFIGFYVVQKLIKHGFQVIGIDNINAYYDVNLKYARLGECGIDKDKIEINRSVQSNKYENYLFQKTDLVDQESLSRLFETEAFDVVINLAAQAGVRYSIENPYSYIQSNVVGFINILECCRHHQVKHLVYASSSSVYGMSNKLPLSEDDVVDFPVSLYAATKKSDELMAHTYSYLYHLPTTGLRFFTVYGPWGRPDMSPMLFADSILSQRPIRVFNNGDMLRDFTYIDDIVDGIFGVLSCIPDAVEPHPYYRLLNIGHSEPVLLMQFIHSLEEILGQTACLEMCPMQAGDVKETFADVSKLKALTGYTPHTELKQGLEIFVSWYRKYNNK
ncbi:NAD-dependent epimerase/dehydratase family protein [uncultured Bacteroides sp.]|uniref:NAD-dependent epimerase/dehydratase family protein n=1 Tax=uncultured Bacteroides sp. TaxID=162156 RepID=UPI002AA8EEC5|nr:NAD-dependent epimerase/dehydratase family protein [uncultured Bacteroides sp.]